MLSLGFAITPGGIFAFVTPERFSSRCGWAGTGTVPPIRFYKRFGQAKPLDPVPAIPLSPFKGS
jgi:hypothetical protein